VYFFACLFITHYYLLIDCISDGASISMGSGFFVDI
jgi:hypothetical protein